MVATVFFLGVELSNDFSPMLLSSYAVDADEFGKYWCVTSSCVWALTAIIFARPTPASACDANLARVRCVPHAA